MAFKAFYNLDLIFLEGLVLFPWNIHVYHVTYLISSPKSHSSPKKLVYEVLQ